MISSRLDAYARQRFPPDEVDPILGLLAEAASDSYSLWRWLKAIGATSWSQQISPMRAGRSC
ncbi:hypothetical protein FB565_007619 [Actinoplanes lutulentus]|uniref:Uncharacterized protein n=1 Tax=Actinoplanes lutulentus TaxID=1287878 RepID=A0A327Z3D9_9ACTN|nr:hypothetical protein [Actinoplanes lutulentus]MBB2947848.1 hypothetical protein [Actinoplanes lutulentus]RAK29839.1 hypothetical protein B0I29_117165 [Actinoplanes lutulentus]